jgi:hypothetical protein
MAIGEIPILEESLSAIKLAPQAPQDGKKGARLPLRPASDETGKVTQDALWLHYSTDTKVSFERILEHIRKDLTNSGHPKPDEFSIFVLALARLMPPHQGTAVARLNTVLASVCEADVSLYFVIPPVLPDFYQFEIPPFRLGRLRTDKLKYRSDRAGSDYYERYRDDLRDAWGIEREPKTVRVLDLQSFRHRILDVPAFVHAREPWEVQAWNALTDEYFSVQNQVLFNDFWTELITAQDALLALGAAYFDPQTVRSSVFRNLQVAVFLNLGGARTGYVAPAGVGFFHIELANTHVRVPQLLDELKRQYNFEQFDASPLHMSIKLFASFVARARRHQLSGHIDEALLHFIIALELIFGVREAIQRSVAERVALITFRQAGRSFEQQCRWINKIYDLRSRYVHEGTMLADEAPVAEMYALCQQVFRCLLRLHAAHPVASQRGKETLARWLSLLDFLSKGITAGKDIGANQLTEAFIV